LHLPSFKIGPNLVPLKYKIFVLRIRGGEQFHEDEEAFLLDEGWLVDCLVDVERVTMIKVKT